MRSSKRQIGVLALQGAVSEHLEAARRLGHIALTVKTPEELTRVDALILPGGESTAISRLIQKNGLYEPIRKFAQTRPIFGTCAGLILCGTEILGQPAQVGQENQEKVIPLRLLPSTVSRNGFGRQVDSFETTLAVKGIGTDIPAVFIRAPYIEKAGAGVNVLASLTHPGCQGEKIVMAEAGNILVTAFHPELTGDLRILEHFCGKIS
jgi:5'-phosphate synthase pdxT subunit